MVDRGWAGRLLSWRWTGSLLMAEISAARYFIRGDPHEAIAWAEARDVDGRRRIEIGTFGSVSAARGACELDAQRRCLRAQEERPAVDVRISAGGRGRDAAISRGAMERGIIAPLHE
jgi:hypothetical protein